MTEIDERYIPKRYLSILSSIRRLLSLDAMSNCWEYEDQYLVSSIPFLLHSLQYSSHKLIIDENDQFEQDCNTLAILY